MSVNELWLVLGMALVTFLTRYPTLAIVSKIDLPPKLLAALKFIPPAVLTALILPILLVPDGTHPDLSHRNSYLVAGLVTVVVAWRSRNLLLTLAVGMLAFWGWRVILAALPFA